MIIVGIAPGLKSIAYSVLDVSGAAAIAIDQDVLLGPRVKEGLADLARKAYAHHLILEVILERALYPNAAFGLGRKRIQAALAIGPACNPKEPPAHVLAVRVMLTALARQFSVPTATVTESQLHETLSPSPRESLYHVVNRRLSVPLAADERRTVLAVAIAMAGGALIREASP